MSQPPYVLILAGGSGERFWPLSRRAKPKQLLKLFSNQTLLEETIARLAEFVPPERILILTNQDQETAVRVTASALPPENIVAEPAKRDTAAAIALAVGWVARRDPQATMIVLPARPRDPRQRGLLPGSRGGSGGGGGIRRAGDDRHPADLGVPGVWLHRAR